MFKLYVIIGCVIAILLLIIDMFNESISFLVLQLLLVGIVMIMAGTLNAFIDEKIQMIKNKKG